MLVIRTTEDPTDPVGEFISAQQTLGLDHFALAVNPFGLYQPDTIHPSTRIALSLDSKDCWDFLLSWRGSENPVWRKP